MILKKIRQNKILTAAFVVYLAVGIYNFDVMKNALNNSWIYIREMLEILPAVFVLSGLIGIWVPQEVIINNFGRDSGLKGKFISVFIGAVSAGPIYAAFPVTRTLYGKGASLANTIIIISAWAVIKVPMFIVESKFLGLKFAITRYSLTIPAIIVLGIVCEKLISRKNVDNLVNNQEDKKIEKIVEKLPGYNCGSCGYNNCHEYAKAIFKKDESLDKCTPGGEEVERELSKVM